MLAVLLALGTTLAGCASSSDGDSRPAPAPTTATPAQDASAAVAAPSPHPRGAVETCSSRSEANFSGAFSDTANLVVGPLVLVGAGDPTSAAVVEAFGGQKFPLLVKEGHVVTMQVPASARSYAALGYGPLPQGTIGLRDGHDTVTFFACDEDAASGSSADRAVTFWSGFLLAGKPSCVPLDLYIDDEPARRRVEVELGRPC